MVDDRRDQISNELAFLGVLDRFLPDILGARIIREPRIKNLRPDYIAEWSSGAKGIVEAKSVTPNTQSRLSSVVKQLNHYADGYQELHPEEARPELILAVPEVFSPRHIDYLYRSGVHRVIDGPILRRAGAGEGISAALAEPADAQSSSLQLEAGGLLGQLESTPPGKADWSAYQTLCGNVLSFLLCPPLSQPIDESSNRSRVNRRDFVMPNYATDGYWKYMRDYYEAHYIVVDAKNYVGNVKKNEILQLANYLNAHGAGLFGLIISRTGADKSAEVTRREQWVIHRKLVVVLNDDDLRQMISLRIADTDPAELVRQKIEDFRLGF